MRIGILILLINLGLLAQLTPGSQGDLIIDDGLDLLTSAESRQIVIRQMARQAWFSYEAAAWGQETAKSRRPPKRQDNRPGCSSESNSTAHSGETIFHSLTTLWIMNLTEPFERAREWIERDFDHAAAILSDPQKTRNLHTFIAPLLSTYALTGDELFLNKSIELAALDMSKNSEAAVVEEQLLEYQYLSHLTENSSYINRVKSLKSRLWRINLKNDEDYYLNGFPYSFEVKRAAQLNATQKTIQLDRYRRIIDQAEPTSLIVRLKNVTYYQNLPFSESMQIKHCSLGATLVQGARLWERLYPTTREREAVRADRDVTYARELTDTCADVARSTAARLPPYKFKFDSHGLPIIEFPRYELSQELVESQFALWRKTQDSKYREAAWNLTKAIFRNARFPTGGYGCVKDVTRVPTVIEDYQPIKLLSGTLKYLFLIFSDDADLLPSDDWVWNSMGHPFPVCDDDEVNPRKCCMRKNLV